MLVRAINFQLFIIPIFVCSFLLSACSEPSLNETDPKSFYQNNVLKIIVGVNPGGGFDEYARMVAKEIETRTGGKVIVENQPGGGTLLALNRLVQGEADGISVMLIGGEAMILAQLTDRPGTRFNIQELNWLGRIQKDTPVVLWSSTLPERNFQEVLSRIKQQGSVWGSSGLTDNISDAEAIFGETLGLSAEHMGIITGYSGSNETALATLRGEVDGMIVSSTSARNYVSTDNSKGLIPILILDRERDLEFFPAIPTIFELLDLSPQASIWVDFRSRVSSVGRSFVTHIDVDSNKVEYLRKLLEEILTDQDFKNMGMDRNRPVNYLSPYTQKQLVDDFSCLAAANINNKVWWTVASVNTPGVLPTSIPLDLQSPTSILLKPTA